MDLIHVYLVFTHVQFQAKLYMERFFHYNRSVVIVNTTVTNGSQKKTVTSQGAKKEGWYM